MKEVLRKRLTIAIFERIAEVLRNITRCSFPLEHGIQTLNMVEYWQILPIMTNIHHTGPYSL